jgi:hypothetical protein
MRPSRTWGSGRAPKRAASPTLRDGIIPVERTVHDGGPDFQHKISAPRRPAHLLLGTHSPMQQPLHRALCDRRRNWFFASAGCGVVDDDVRLSRNICLEIAQKAPYLACGGSNRRLTVGCNAHCNDGFGNEIQSAFDLTMPETPSDPLDRLGEASTSVAISLRGVGPACGRLGDVLNPHREVEPVQYMMGWTGAGGFAERSWTICTIAQDGDRCRWRRFQSVNHSARLSTLRSRLRRHAGEYDLFPLIIADLSEENLERAPLILTSRPNVAAVNGEGNRFRRHRRLGSGPRDSLLLRPGANRRVAAGRFPWPVACRAAETPPAASAPGGRVTANPSLRRSARTPACMGRA